MDESSIMDKETLFVQTLKLKSFYEKQNPPSTATNPCLFFKQESTSLY